METTIHVILFIDINYLYEIISKVSNYCRNNTQSGSFYFWFCSFRIPCWFRNNGKVNLDKAIRKSKVQTSKSEFDLIHKTTTHSHSHSYSTIVRLIFFILNYKSLVTDALRVMVYVALHVEVFDLLLPLLHL